MIDRAALMQRALTEAARARGRTHPNPMVGCVVAHGDTVVAVGHHVKAGTPHAEVVALRRAGAHARGADVYVTLEPCNHYGRTGPCAEALVEAGVARVFVGMRDPNPLVNGRGIRRLRTAGIEVQIGLLGPECARLNQGFVHAIRYHRPFVAACLLRNLEGESLDVAQLSAASRKRLQILRNEFDAVLVQASHVQGAADGLRCALRGGRDPIRVVLDADASLPSRAEVLRVVHTSTAPTWIVVGADVPAARLRRFEKAGVVVITCKMRRGQIALSAMMEKLCVHGLNAVLLEGEGGLTQALLEQRLVSQVHTFMVPQVRSGARLTSVVTDVCGDDIVMVGDASM